MKINHEKQKNCKYCSGNVKGRAFIDGMDLYIGENGSLMSRNYNTEVSKINFCPWCGRDLTENDIDVEWLREAISRIVGK